MTVWRAIWDFGKGLLQVTDFAAVYYGVQLGLCVLYSFFILGLILVLRRALSGGNPFCRCALWSLLLPAPFLGRLRFVFESRLGVRTLYAWVALCYSHPWICRAYMGVALLLTGRLLWRRVRLCRWMDGLPPVGEAFPDRVNLLSAAGASAGSANPQSAADASSDLHNLPHTAALSRPTPIVRVTDAAVSPFSAGLLRPRIVLPRRFLTACTERELRLILLHERTHIRLGHLWLLAAWDILGALLWANPLLRRCTGLFAGDLEAVCDAATVRQSGGDAADYGRVLLHSLRLIREAHSASGLSAAFADAGTFREMKRRIGRLAAYRPYSRTSAAAALLLTLGMLAAATAGIRAASFARWTPLESAGIFIVRETNPGARKARERFETETVLLDTNHSVIRAIDGAYVCIDGDALRDACGGLPERPDDTLWISCGGFYKLPGMGGGGGYASLSPADVADGVFRVPFVDVCDPWIELIRLL